MINLKKAILNPKRTIPRALVFYRQGASLFQLLLSLVTTTILVGEYILPNIPRLELFIYISTPIVVSMIVFGRLDFKYFTYPQTAQESIKNSPPARDSYEFFATLLKNLMDKGIVEKSDSNKRLLESMEKWYK